MKKNKKGNVYIVIAMDTEGPIVNKKKPDIIDNWNDTKKLIKEITKSSFRTRFKDSNKAGLIYSWFILTLTGFKTNPYKRPMKYHQTYDFYLKNFANNFKIFKDGIYWHYHQPSKSRVGNEWSRDWFSSNEYLNILNKLIVERNFFPSCFRAGGRIEDNNLSHWLEEFIPFDFSNCSGDIDWNRIESDGKKLIEVADWSKASRMWCSYNPNFKDYQISGKMNRYIFRSVDCNSPVYRVKERDIFEAFKLAEKGRHAVLSIFEHDRRFNLIDNLNEFIFKLKIVSKEFKNIKFFYANAREAANNSLMLKNKKAPRFNLNLTDDRRVMISTNDDIFGSRPYVCILKSKNIQDIPVNRVGEKNWLTPAFKKDLKFKLFVVANNISGYNSVQHKMFEI